MRQLLYICVIGSLCAVLMSQSLSYAAPIAQPQIDAVNGNGGFEYDSVGTIQATGWGFTASRIALGHTDIARCPAPDNTSYLDFQLLTGTSTPNSNDGVLLSYTARGEVVNTEKASGANAYGMTLTTSAGANNRNYVVYGPRLVSASFSATAGQVVTVEFFGYASSGDIAIVEAYLLDENTCDTFPIRVGTIDDTIWGSNLHYGTVLFSQAIAEIRSTSSYKIVIIAGTFDRNGDGSATTTVYVDNATFGSEQQVSWFGAFPNLYIGQTYDLSTMSSVDTGLPITYRAKPASVCTMVGATVLRLMGAGNCHLQAVQAGNSTYAAFTQGRTIDGIPNKSVTATFTNTRTSTRTPTASNTHTNTPTHTRTNTPTHTKSQTNTRTNTHTHTPTHTPTFTQTKSQTPTQTSTNTATNTRTPTPSNTNTNTPTETNTPTDTSTPTDTGTPTHTRTNTSTRTNTPTRSNTSTRTNTPTRTHTHTRTRTHTRTATLTSTATKTPTHTPTSLPITLKDAAIGNSYVLGLLSNGTLVTWGNNDVLQAQFLYVRPESLFTHGPFIDVATAVESSFTIDANGDLYAWGSNAFGELNAPTAAWSHVKAVAAGGRFACVVKQQDTVLGITYAEGSVVCWGDNTDGQTSVPIGLSDVVDIDAGDRHVVALKADGTVVAWGYNNGYLVDPDCVGQPSPATVPAFFGASGANVVEVAAGEDHTLVLRNNGSVHGWGCNTNDQITIPPSVANGVSIAAGRKMSIVARADGSVVAWGNKVPRDFSGAGFGAPPNIQIFPASIQAVHVDSYSQNTIIGVRTGGIFVGGTILDNVNVSRTHTKTATLTRTSTLTATASLTASSTRLPSSTRTHTRSRTSTHTVQPTSTQSRTRTHTATRTP